MFTIPAEKMPHILVGILIYFGAIQLFSYLATTERRKLSLAFFHPYCDGGGGGERVLWVMIYGLLQPKVAERSNIPKLCSIPDKYIAEIIIYSGETTRSKLQILENVEKKFGIVFTDKQKASIHFVNIYSRFLLEAKWYPVATMICQSLGSVIVGLECVWRKHPDIFIDTMGAAFMYPLIRMLYSAKVVAYVHYPIISSDMLKKVRDQRPSYNNAGRIAQSVTVSSIKLIYYQAFAKCYRFCGFFADEVFVNSTWTKNHIEELWCLSRDDFNQARERPLWFPRHLSLVYPPCNTTAIQLKQANVDAHSFDETQLYSKFRVVMSLGQFRPEKDHMLQIKAMEEFIRLTKDRSEYDDVVLVMLGSTRHSDDDALANSLQAYIDSKPVLKDRVFILKNKPYSQVEEFLRHSHVGLHTMWNEHFGISVVEMLAAGLVTIAHNSGGPKTDIIQLGINGFLASEVEEYAELLVKVMAQDQQEEIDLIKIRARESAKRFSDEVFVDIVVKEMDQIIGEVF